MSQHGCPERLSNRSKGFAEEGGSQPTMEVLVETLTGTAFEMTVSPSDTVFAIKSKIFRVEGIPVSQQHLLYNLRELEDSCSLHDLSITDGARLRLVLGMRGGPISTRRLPPPSPVAEPWPDIERLLDSNRDDIEWTDSGCKVTVLLFRDGERVNMLRVKENCDGTYSPIDHNKFSTVVSPPSTEVSTSSNCGVRDTKEALDNATTMNKMMELRRRMETLSLQRHGDKVEIQKTRSEETLSVPRLLDETTSEYETNYTPYNECEHTLALYHRNYDRYGCELSVGARCAVLPTGARARRLPAPDLGVVGSGWRGGHSASALQLRAAPPPRARHPPLFSSSTSELDHYNNSGRMLPALSRHRPREHLHLSDDQLSLAAPPQEKQEKKITVRCGLCRKRLSISTVHECRCGAMFCAPHRYAEVHHCTYDYKATQHTHNTPKLPRI